MEAALKLGKTPSEWLDLDILDRALILTHLANESDRCPLCGHYLSDSTQPHPLEVDGIVCHTCAAVEDANQEHEKQPGEIRFAYRKPDEPEAESE